MALNEIIDLLIGWGPTILFLLIVLISTLSGIKKGVRKEAISIVHTIICFTICLIIFMLLVENRKVDTLFLDFINKILGGEGSLQQMLGVSAKHETIREILVEYIPKQLSFVDGLELILKDNGAYLYTLVDMLYRVTFALVIYIFYLLLKLICYFIYLCFYPERRRIKKVRKDFENGLVDNGYIKHRGLGAVIGATRGLVFGLVTMSFIGSIFFIVAGGDGTRRQEDVDYGDPTLNLVGNAYSSITEYGTEGIFKIFNMVKDKNDVPYYLFAADLIFTGGLKDENLGVNENIIFRDELAAYVNFARSTYSLLLKYGGDDLRNIIKNDENAKDPMEVFTGIMLDRGFQDEFDDFIIEFDSKTYFINLALSLVDSLASNIDELNIGVPEEASEIVKICFKKGYLSERIPEEKELLDAKNSDSSANSNPTKYELEYIRPSYLVNKDDFKQILRGFFDFINKSYESQTLEISEEKLTLDLTSAIINRVKFLSIFETNKKDNLNPVIKRLYKFIDIAYLQVDKSVEYRNNTTSLASYDSLDKIDWMGELLSLVDVCKIGIDTFAYGFIEKPLGTDYFRLFLNEFKTTNKDYIANLKALDEIIGFIGHSQILGQVLSSSVIYQNIEDSLEGAMGGDLVLKVNYTNTYDSAGNLVEYGELYYLTNAISIIAKEEDMILDIESLIYDLLSDDEVNDIVMKLITNLNKQGINGSILDNVSQSGIGQSLLSSLIYSDSFEVDIASYVDDRLLDVDENNNPIKLIKKNEIKDLLTIIPTALPVINELMGSIDITLDDILELLENPIVEDLFTSRLLESIVTGYALESFSQMSDIIVPRHVSLITIDNEVSELRSIYDILKLNIIDLNEILNATDPSIYLNILESLKDEDIDNLLKSKIIYFNINNAITSLDLGGGIEIIVPKTVVSPLEDEVINELIKVDEFKKVFKVLPSLLPSDINNVDPNEMVVAIALNKDQIITSDLLTATIAYFIVNGLDTGGVIEIPINLATAAKKDVLVNEFNESPWPHELDSFVLALDEVLDITTKGYVDLDTIEETILSEVNKLNKSSGLDPTKTKLDLLYESNIITNVLSTQVDISIKEIFTKEDLKDLKDSETGLYKKEEFSTLVHMLDIFTIDLNELSNPNYDLQQTIIDNVDVLEQRYSETETNLDYLYHGNLLGILLNQVLCEAGIDIPNAARLEDTNVIKKEEAEALLSLKVIFPSLNEINLTNINIIDLKNNKDSLASSTIFSANIYSNLSILDEIVIPATVTINDSGSDYIKAVELERFIDIITTKENCDLLFKENLDGSYDLTTVKELDLNSLDTARLRCFATSTILEGTCIYLLGSNIDIVNSLPTDYQSSINKKSLANDPENIWIKNGEMNKLIDALDAVMATSNITSILDFIDENKIIEYIDYGALRIPYGKVQTSIEIAYESIIIKANVSSILDSILTADLINQDVKNNTIVIKEEKYTSLYRGSEIKALLEAFNSLGLKISNIQNEGVDVDLLMNACFSEINKSYLASSILTTQIDKALSSIVTNGSLNSTIVKENVYGINRYKEDELNNLINTLNNKKLGLGSLSNLTFDGDTNLTVAKVEALYDGNSYLIRYVIAATLDSVLTKPLINQDILPLAKDELETYYLKEEMVGLVDVLSKFGMTSMNSLNNLNVNINFLNEIIYNESILAKGILTTQIKDNLGNTIIIPNKAYDTNGLLLWAEIEPVIGFVDSQGNFSGIDSIILNDSNIATISKSSILNANVTAKIKNIASFVIPDRAYESTNELLTKIELTNLLKAINTLNLNLSNPDISSIKPSDIESKISMLTNSDILRATISRFIVDAGTSSGAAFNVGSEYVEELMVGGFRKQILKALEIENFIAALNVINGLNSDSYGLTLDLNIIMSLSSANIYKVFNSSIATNLLSDLIIGTTLYDQEFPWTRNLITIEDENGLEEEYLFIEIGYNTYKLHDSTSVEVYSFNQNKRIKSLNITAKDVLAFVRIIDSLPII